jgi:hypothetical protein
MSTAHNAVVRTTIGILREVRCRLVEIRGPDAAGLPNAWGIIKMLDLVKRLQEHCLRHKMVAPIRLIQISRADDSPLFWLFRVHIPDEVEPYRVGEVPQWVQMIEIDDPWFKGDPQCDLLCDLPFVFHMRWDNGETWVWPPEHTETLATGIDRWLRFYDQNEDQLTPPATPALLPPGPACPVPAEPQEATDAVTDERPPTPTAAYCLLPGKRVRWENEPVKLRKQLWGLLKYLLSRDVYPIPAHEVQLEIWGLNQPSPHHFSNMIGSLNKDLEQVAFPWKWRADGEAVERDG